MEETIRKNLGIESEVELGERARVRGGFGYPVIGIYLELGIWLL